MFVLKRSFSFAAVMLAMLAGIFCAPASAQSAQTSCPRVVMVGHPDYPPFSWAVGKRLIGMGPSLMEALAADDEVAVIVARGKAFPYKDRNSLIGKHGVTSNGESYEDSLDTFINARLDVTRVPGQAAVLRALVEGKADYAIVPLATGLAEARILQLQDKIEVLSKTLLVTKMFIAFGRQSPCRDLADRFNRKLKELVSNGTVKRMVIESNDLWDQRNELR